MKGIFGSGTNDFLAVRISSLILLSYFLYLTFFVISNAPISFDLWNGLFENIVMKIFTTLFLLSFGIHTWIGTWAIGSDYLTLARLGGLGLNINKFYLAHSYERVLPGDEYFDSIINYWRVWCCNFVNINAQ